MHLSSTNHPSLRDTLTAKRCNRGLVTEHRFRRCNGVTGETAYKEPHACTQGSSCQSVNTRHMRYWGLRSWILHLSLVNKICSLASFRKGVVMPKIRPHRRNLEETSLVKYVGEQIKCRGPPDRRRCMCYQS
jgi:hypothetical protein